MARADFGTTGRPRQHDVGQCLVDFRVVQVEDVLGLSKDAPALKQITEGADLLEES